MLQVDELDKKLALLMLKRKRPRSPRAVDLIALWKNAESAHRSLPTAKILRSKHKL
jgi:hypothetical protein